MAKVWAKKFYNSKAWRNCRQGYIQSIYGLCERCTDNGKEKAGDILHHITYLTPDNIHDPDITLNWDNLEYLCQTCHNQEHHERYGVTRVGIKFNEYGDIVEEEQA
jgi:5-methylcytosine-specific restriction enzyme A